MFGKAPHLELPRRVTAYYLLFGLAAICWLTIGAIVVSQTLQTSQTEGACLNQLGKAAMAVGRDYLRYGEANLQALVERLKFDGSLVYCAVVSPDGRFMAHSSRDRVGQPAVEPAGSVVSWGDVQRIRFVDEDSRILREYQTPLRRGDKTYAMLRMAVPDSGIWATVLRTAEYAPAAILGPLLLMAAGALVLQRTVRPLSAIESQLRQAADVTSLADLRLQQVAPAGPVSIGWNQLVSQWTKTESKTNLDTRLTEALEGFRQRKTDFVLNSLPDGVAVTDESGRITFANQALAALLGIGTSGDGLCGRSMEDCLMLNSGGAVDASLLDSQLKGRTVVIELGRPGDPSQGVWRVARHPLRSASSGAGSGHVWCVRDITQQKLADQMRNQFVYSATHELRTPLANIKAYAETLALSDVLDVERQKEFCNTINSEATRLARFIDDLLSISSIEVGALSLARQETDVERMLRETVEKVRPQMKQKHITFDVVLPEKTPKMMLDKDKITATLVNLLGNAAKYTPEGGRVGFKVEAREKQLQIDVEDTGFGIAEEELNKIFDKFFRSADPRVQQQTGSGLGLSLALEVVRLHGGKLSVHSQLNKGSRFTITLPLT